MIAVALPVLKKSLKTVETKEKSMKNIDIHNSSIESQNSIIKLSQSCQMTFSICKSRLDRLLCAKCLQFKKTVAIEGSYFCDRHGLLKLLRHPHGNTRTAGNKLL